MSQSNVIAGALVIAFLIFITVRGELMDYVQLFSAKRQVKSQGGDDFKFSIEGIADAGEALFDFGNVIGDFDFSGDAEEEIPDGVQTEI